MEQKTINQNKLQTILCIIALTLGVLVSAVLFSVTPVHAEESSYSHKYTVTWKHTVTTWKYPEIRICIFSLDNQLVLVRQKSSVEDVYTYFPKAFIQNEKYPNGILVNLNDSLISGKFNWDVYYTKDNVTQEFHNQQNQLWISQTCRKDVYSDGTVSESIIEADFPIFDSNDHALAFCRSGSQDGLLNPDSINTTDKSYSFTGFTMNGKTARWTGTTERSCAKDVDVEEYVKVSYAWATTTEPDNLGELQAYDGEFPTSDKQLTLPWSEMENGKTDFQFIRQVKISPCYRVPNLAYYIGQPVTIYYNADGSIDKISNPNTPGILDESIPIPVLSVDNDNGTFLFTNAQNDYKFELKGRFWSTDDFYVFRKTPSLVWQYKYLTLLKNSLTTWVSVGDNMSTLSTYSFGDLGAESWNDLINTYPIENRNIITGEQQGWFSWANITGYNDAVTTLKTLLSTPYSLFNGYEVYVRYYVVCGDGSIRYSKWTHYFNNLADADGSTGSIVDDASNMNNGNQSDKGLTDSDIDNVENSGNSRNDVDAKPSSDFSVDISNVTELFSQFINILKSFYSGMGQLPSLINAIFGFLPSWVSAMIGVSLFVIVILRIIGR